MPLQAMDIYDVPEVDNQDINFLSDVTDLSYEANALYVDALNDWVNFWRCCEN